jgi:hypothetical protein
MLTNALAKTLDRGLIGRVLPEQRITENVAQTGSLQKIDLQVWEQITELHPASVRTLYWLEIQHGQDFQRINQRKR